MMHPGLFYVRAFIFSCAIGLLNGCAAISSSHDGITPESFDVKTTKNTPVSAKTSTGIRERDLTVEWNKRHYWMAHQITTQVPAATSGGTRSLQVRRLSSPPITPITKRQPAPRNVFLSRRLPPIAPKQSVGPLPPGLSYRIWFAPETEVLGPEGVARIQRLAQSIKMSSGATGETLWLRGYVLSDETPPSRERFAVGRALSVRNALRHEGVPLTTPVRIHHPKLDLSGRYVEVSIR